MKKEKNVQPIRSLKDIQKMKDSLFRYCSYRDYFLFIFGINTGLRISDILPLKVRDVKNKTQIQIQEKKTMKFRTIYFNEYLQEEIDKYTVFMKPEELLFPSRKGNNHISPTQAYRTLLKAAEIVGIKHTGTRSLRKTYGYHHYKKHKNIDFLQEFFSHPSPNITKKYIGIRQEETANKLNYLNL
ncbi:tyrosine-type recombinase/integrase [Bacillus sp. NPDC077027]|uniref:tyrosine-type recombinase/integrase n=1 Tax=Bacillus sp. NPDC077027 TaxID=3390548 RepID=UPI003CFE9C50